MILSPEAVRLLALCCCRKDGGTIAKAYEEATENKICKGTLFTTLRRLIEKDLICIAKCEDDKRKRFYWTTEAGKRALKLNRDYYKELADFWRI